MTYDDYYNARWVVEPFRLYDNCLINDGGRAFVVTSTERGRNLRHCPAIITGAGFANPCYNYEEFKPLDRPSGIKTSSEMALKMAGLTINDVDALEPYDCFTWGVESDLMDLGFFGPGEGADWLKDGTTAPGGKMPMATSGGMLSEAYYMGVTAITEAAMQLMGRCGDRQLGSKTGTKEPEIILCWDKGGMAQGSLATIILRSG
jgi:acetyl-CoA acetyltransferase